MGTKVKSVRVEMGDSVDVGDTLVINNSCRFSTAKLPTKVSDLANDCCYLTEEALSCAVCGKADKEYVDCCLSAKQDCGDYALNCDLTSGLNSKQDVINDLSTIRANACCGKVAHTTIGTYGDIVTHDACEFQEAGDYALNCTMTACLACKYDASNPCCYQTATEVACTVSPKADKTYVDCCIGELENDIEQLQGRGKFLSNWDATTGKPETDPETLPYEYHTGDYYMVTVVGSNNKRPTGSSYTGEASTTAETSELAEGDMYAYDGTNWLLQSNHGKTVSFANLSGVPSDNACLCSELASKQDNIDDLNTIRTNACCGKNASDTIATYGDVVTHNACEFQVAGDYATNSTLESCLACKQNNISDLDTIRTNACCGACAKTIISGYGDIVSHNASEFQAAGNYAQCCDLTTGLSGKVDKVNGINRIYGTDGSGCQTDYAYSDTVTGNSVAKRDACGNLCVADPTCNSHAATKGYVDDKVDNKVICWGSIAGTLACQTDLQTALNCKQDNISDLNSIRIGAGKGDTAVQPGDLAAVATSGKYCDLTGIPCATTGGTAIAVSNGQVSVCYDNNTIKVNNSDQIYADYTGLQKTCNLVTNFSNADDTHYPSAKAVADIVEGMSGGNMIKEIYDPCNCRKNIYDMDNMYDGSVNKVVTATEKSLWDAKQEALTLPSNPTCGHLVVWGANKKTFVDGGEIPNSATWGCITGTLSNQTDLQNALNCKAQCCDIPTDNCQLANSCGYTTCTGTLTENSLKTVNGCSLVGSGDICIEGGGCSEWGCITGTLCDQTDLQCALDDKVNICDCYTNGDITISRTNYGYNDCYGIAVECLECGCNQGGFLRPNSLEVSYNCNGHVVGSEMRSGYSSLFEYDGAYEDCCVCVDLGGICVCGRCVTDKCYPFSGDCRIATLCDLPAESNTKTFYLCSCDVATTQAAYDWWAAGKNPVIVYSGRTYTLSSGSSTCLRFDAENETTGCCCECGYSYLTRYYVAIRANNGVVDCSIGFGIDGTRGPKLLATNCNYACPYTPKYAGSPTTKKYVDEKVYTGDTAPVTAVEGQIWSDTCSNMVKYYDGSQWNVLTAGGSTGTGDVTGPNSSVDGHIAVFDSTSGKIIKDGGPIPEGKSYTAGKGICIEDTYCDCSTIRGPAPEGFHVPSKDEFSCLFSTLVDTLGLPNTSGTPSTYLKLPTSTQVWNYAGGSSSGYSRYWTSTGKDENSAYTTCMISNSIKTFGETYTSYGLPIRAFKNEPVLPSPTRCVLYDGSSVADGAGVFWDEVCGLISISGDGVAWTTISDKNIGATCVGVNNIYSYGCMYQWGNNYGFPTPSFGVLTYTSNTQADTCGCQPSSYCCCVFIARNSQPYGWSCVCNNNLWGGETGIATLNNVITDTSLTDLCVGTGMYIGSQSSMQGPSPNGFHVPTINERNSVINMAVCGLSLPNDGASFNEYLKLPYSGVLCICSRGTYYGQSGLYWTSNVNKDGCAHRLFIMGGCALCVGCASMSYGYAIRSFKNTPLIPDNSWTTLYDGSSVAEGAGVFHNTSLGLISISNDGENWITIMDKNLGATTVYNCGDTVTPNNSGCTYQRGNNYGFPSASNPISYGRNVSSTQICSDLIECMGYGPSNPYCCDTFIIGNTKWTTDVEEYVRNLWGGASNSINDVISTYANVSSLNGKTGDICLSQGRGIILGDYIDYGKSRGPAPEGFHVPAYSDWICVHDTIVNCFGFNESCAIGSEAVRCLLKLPLSGRRCQCTGNVTCQGNTGYYWSSETATTGGGYYLLLGSSSFSINSCCRSNGLSIRPFKDIPIIPDNSWTTLYDGSSVAEGAGVFHNCCANIISLSVDGKSWLTLSDRNLGAICAWNYGDAVNIDNAGCYYQWGNNYGFPYCGTVTTSSTLVDASLCGPSSYCCDTFITTSANPYDWSSVQNDNLRGKDTIKKIDNGMLNTGVLSVNGQYGNVTVQAGEPATVVSGDTGTTYTIKVSNTAPSAGTPNTTITFVTA